MEMEHQSMKSLSIELRHAGRCRLPGRDPCDYHNQWLDMFSDMGQTRFEWRRCIYSALKHPCIPFCKLLLFKSYRITIIFSTITDTSITCTTLWLILIFSFFCVDMVWEFEAIHICSRFYIAYDPCLVPNT